MKAVSPTGHANVYRPPGGGYDLVYGYSARWPELIPQHGPGKKHLRPIVLVPWSESGWSGSNRGRSCAG